MDLKEHIKKNLSEIDTYRSHGLFVAAKDKTKALLALIRQSGQFKNKQKLMAAMSKKLEELEDDALKFEETGTESEDLVDELIPFKKEEETDSIALNRAITLLMHGQFEKALSKFSELINKDFTRAVAAENIIRCHIGLSSLDKAVTQYEEWISSGKFSQEELEEIGFFLQGILNQKGIDRVLPIPEKTSDEEEHETDEEEFIDILSIEIPLHNKDLEEDIIKRNVSFQEGNIISVIIPSTMAALVNGFEVGSTLKDVKIYSTAVVFKDSCVISEKRKIESGPKKGGYTLVMKILNE
jgi:tetratricopeptide (TPR) repeat protein